MQTCVEAPEAIAAPELPKVEPKIPYSLVMLPLAVLIFIASFPGQTFGVSVFNEPMRAALGLTHGQFALAYTLGTLFASVPLTFLGRIVDRRGLRQATLWAVVAFGAACCALSQAAGWLTLFLAFFLLRLLGPGVLSIVSSNTLAFWFRRRLGAAEGTRQLGMALAMVAIPSLNLWLLSQFGWRTTYVVFAIAIWALLMPLVLLLYRNRPTRLAAEEQTGGQVEAIWGFSLQQAFRLPSFWIVTGGTALFGLIHTGVFFCIGPILADHGMGESELNMLLTSFAVSLAITNFLGGAAADYAPARTILPVAMLGLAVSMWLLTSMHSSLDAMYVGILMGISQGLYFGASSPLWARYFGLLHLGQIRGAVGTMNVAVSSAAPLLASVARDWSGSFESILLSFGAMALAASLVSVCVTKPKVNTAVVDGGPAGTA